MASVVLTVTDAAWAWSVTGGATELIAEAIGGGGGGGGVTNNTVAGGGGGQGGGYAKVTITKGAETTLNITIGAAGAAGALVDGGAGGFSSIVQGAATVLLAAGGDYGRGGSTSTGFAGGTVPTGTAVGDLTKTGGAGGTGNTATPSSGGGGGAGGPSGNGGNASANTAGAHGGGNFLNGIDYCTLGAAGRITTAAAGVDGGGVGSAGSGGLATGSTNRVGGAGYRGVVVLTWNDPVKTTDSFKHTDVVQVAVSASLILSISSVADSFKHTDAVAALPIDPQWIKLLLSSNVAASAATHTTAQLTAPAGKTSGANFQEGHISDDTNPITSTDLDSGKYSELEWSLQTQGIAESDEVEFRITNAGTVIDTYTLTPKITGGTGVTHLSINVSDCTSQETQIGA